MSDEICTFKTIAELHPHVVAIIHNAHLDKCRTDELITAFHMTCIKTAMEASDDTDFLTKLCHVALRIEAIVNALRDLRAFK